MFNPNDRTDKVVAFLLGPDGWNIPLSGVPTRKLEMIYDNLTAQLAAPGLTDDRIFPLTRVFTRVKAELSLPRRRNELIDRIRLELKLS